MRQPIAAFGAGLLFGLGLTVSQMVNPAKVLGFLDIFGAWDPSLALVMAGAVVPAAAAFRLALRRKAPLLAARFQLPTARAIDLRLMLGAALFGVGWGLVGLCPGPAIAALPLDGLSIPIFVLAMLAGMLGHRLQASRWSSSESSPAPQH
jgi:hypothetical protein